MRLWRIILRVWKTCDTCGGAGTIPNPRNGGGPITCPACGGAGGINTETV